MSLSVFPSPWAVFAGEEGAALRGETWQQACGAVHPRLLGLLPDGCTWNGVRPMAATETGEPQDVQWDLPFAVSGEQDCSVVAVKSQTKWVEFIGLPSRAADSVRDTDPREQWLIWQLQRYAELGDLGSPDGQQDDLEARIPTGARRTWRSVERYWRMGGDEAAELALIVRLAQNDRFVHAIRSIERGPRRMLLRHHEMVKIARIQEMDSATLRAYSQAPGMDPVQKAGSKQELLAVVRRDTVDLVENRILLWVAKRMRRMAEVYCQKNRGFKESDRFQRVRQLHQLCQNLLRSPRLEDISGLPHHVGAPTYCLQFERRYRQLWLAYQMIRRQDRLEDDAWQWQTRFWGTSARLIIASMLLGMDGWTEPRLSMPYIRAEGICGQWVHGPSTPGPLATPYGECHVLDLRAGHGFRGAPSRQLPIEAVRSGADWILVWPDRRKLLLLWSAVATGVRATDPAGLGLVQLSARMTELSKSTDWEWGGILFIAEPEADSSSFDYLDALAGVVALRVPIDVHARWEEVQTGLQLALEELHSE